jgi:hypothetical protein
MLHYMIYKVALGDALGYGTGYWLYDMRERHPSCGLVGIDIAIPTREMCSPGQNIHFIGGFSFEQDAWPFADGQFNLIHMSGLCGSVADWAKLCSTALK